MRHNVANRRISQTCEVTRNVKKCTQKGSEGQSQHYLKGGKTRRTNLPDQKMQKKLDQKKGKT
jgi:hypothetical protein